MCLSPRLAYRELFRLWSSSFSLPDPGPLVVAPLYTEHPVRRVPLEVDGVDVADAHALIHCLALLSLLHGPLPLWQEANTKLSVLYASTLLHSP